MSWTQALYETYNRLEKDKENFSRRGLLKSSQSTQNAHIEITIDKDGSFLNAGFVDKANSVTTIPVNEESASRGSGNAPHPLFDKLKYLAADYMEYGGDDNTEHHKKYMDNLKEWCESDFSNPKIKAVYSYLKKGNIIKDLVDTKIFSVGADGLLTKKWENSGDHKLSAGNQIDAFIRFRVEGLGTSAALWEDPELQDMFIGYYLNQESENQLCYITGIEKRTSMNHPSKIRHSGDKAKMISANDNTNFTFRGLFDTSSQAFSIGYDTSQRMHNALKWLISTQGVKVGDKVFVLWGVDGEDTPPIIADTPTLAGTESESVDTAKDIADRFNNAILGYKNEINPRSHLVLLGLDAATTGRLSVIYCREYFAEQGKDLIDNIEKWHQTCKWFFSYKKDEKNIYYIGAPSPINIARATFGTDQNGLLKADDKVLANTVERLLPSISESRKIPKDIVDMAVNKSKMPQNYSSESQWLHVLAVACALYSKYLFDYKKEEVSMSVTDTSDINYNCGRLLAVADAIEKWALREKANSPKDIRPTNAMRFYSRFCHKPLETWTIINEKLVPYKLQLGERANLLNDLLGEISEKIDIEDFKKVTNLDGRFCLGFDVQRRELRSEAIEKSKKKKDEQNK